MLFIKLKTIKMEALKLNKDTAIKLYPNASTEFKKMLEETFGEKALRPKVTDRVKTFENACRVLGIKATGAFTTNTPVEELLNDCKSISAYAKLIVIARALNGGWEPDWNDSDEYKYYPWFRMSSGSASGFSCDGYGYGCTSTGVGARLCFKSRELAEYAGKQFEDIYREFMML